MCPLDREFNRAVLAMAPAYVAQSFAPATLAEFMQSPPLLRVYDGGSDATIYADPRVNFAFRAWHDATHREIAGAFTLAGEREVCEVQVRALYARFPSAPLAWARILRAEVIGQAEYFVTYGTFPADQRAFVSAYLGETDQW